MQNFGGEIKDDMFTKQQRTPIANVAGKDQKHHLSRKKCLIASLPEPASLLKHGDVGLDDHLSN